VGNKVTAARRGTTGSPMPIGLFLRVHLTCDRGAAVALARNIVQEHSQQLRAAGFRPLGHVIVCLAVGVNP